MRIRSMMLCAAACALSLVACAAEPPAADDAGAEAGSADAPITPAPDAPAAAPGASTTESSPPATGSVPPPPGRQREAPLRDSVRSGPIYELPTIADTATEPSSPAQAPPR